MKLQNLNKVLIFAALPLMMLSCGEPNDREAQINPKIEGKLITLKNVEDITKNASPTLYSKATSTATSTTTTSTTTSGSNSTVAQPVSAAPTVGLPADVQKLVALVASADRKAYLSKHLDAGHKIGFAFHADHIRVYALTTKDVITKIASAPADLTITDIRNAKTSGVDKKTYVKASRTDVNPTSSERFIEVAAIEIEKSGVLESEKTDYNETKPLLSILTNLPIEVSTHVLLKQEIVLSGSEFKKLSDDGKVEATPAN